MSIKSFYAKIHEQLNQKLPFVVYRKANSDIIEVFLQQNDTLFEIEDYSKVSGFVFAPFNIAQKTILIPIDQSDYYSLDIQDKNISEEDTPKIFSNTTENQEEKEKHLQLINKGISAIKTGDFEKVVLSRIEEIEGLDIANPLSIFEKLESNYSTAFCYLWYHPEVGMWSGATPETLLHCRGQQFTTMALAGTQPYKANSIVNWARKELKEQEIVTSFIVNGLTSISNTIKASKTYSHRAGSLVHLRTDISGDLNISTSGIEDVIKILHPTPAICGVPKDKARSFILDNEGYDRKYYTGFLGELNIGDQKKESALFVNLRCMELKHTKAILYIGGGITKDSNPDSEWEETVKKTETMKKVLF